MIRKNGAELTDDERDYHWGEQHLDDYRSRCPTPFISCISTMWYPVATETGEDVYDYDIWDSPDEPPELEDDWDDWDYEEEDYDEDPWP